MTPREIRMAETFADLVYSPDDGGWYIHPWNEEPSPLFDTEAEARDWAKRNGRKIVKVEGED